MIEDADLLRIVEDSVRARKRLRQVMKTSHDVTLLVKEMVMLKTKVKTLYDAIAHGEPERRTWLREKIDSHFSADISPKPVNPLEKIIDG